MRRSLLFNTAVYIVGQFLTKALAFVLLVIYARYLEPADFGITGTLGAYSLVLGTVFVMGLHGSVSRHYFDLRGDPAELRSYLSSVYVFQLGCALVLVVLLEIFGEPLWQRVTSGNIPFGYARIMLWTTFLVAAVAIPQALYQAQERAAVLVGWQLAQAILAVAVGAVFVAAFEQRALGVLRSQCVAAAALAAVLLLVFVRDAGSRVLRMKHVRAALRYGLPLVPHTLGTILMQTVDRIMLENYASQTDVGLYSIAMLLTTTLAMLAGAINQAWAPHFFRTSTEEAAEVARGKAETFASLFIAMSAGLSLVGALLAPELLHVLGASYLPVAPYLVPFVIGNLLAIVYILPANQLLLGSETRWFVIATGAGTLLSIGLNAWLLPRGYGGMAAAWIFVAGTAVQTGVIFFAALVRHRSLMGARHAAVLVVTFAMLGAATHPFTLAVRAAMLGGGLAVVYALLVRGKLRAAWPYR